jgi:hypothetical protein
MTLDEFEQVDVVLTEDGRCVWLLGYTADDRCYLQTFTLPVMIDEANLIPNEWRRAARSDAWRLFE